MAPLVECVTAPVSLGEGPHWCVRDQALYYVDIFNQHVHRYQPATNTHTKMHIEGGPVTLVVPHASSANTFVVSVGCDLGLVTWDDPSRDVATTYRRLTSVEASDPDNRFNDGKCDDLGRLWAGTMGPTDVPDNPKPDRGNLYILGQDSSITQVLDKVSISNGLAWSADNKTFYFVDTAAYKVEAFDCNLETGSLSGRRTIYDYRQKGLYPHFPDGMTIDTEGRLWVASFGTSKVHCINPNTGKVEQEVELPASNLTSVCWGGPELDHLYVTTTVKNLTPEQLRQQPQAGAVFRVSALGCKGQAPVECKVDL